MAFPPHHTPRCEQASHRSTYMACCAGYVSQAAVVNLTALLFVPLREQFGFSYAQLGALVLVNFVTQLIADVGCSSLIDKIGFRFFAVTGHVCVVLGFILFALTPTLPVPPYPGFVAATVLFSLGGGMLELIVSPIVNTLPAKEKSASMSILHSFYCWGQVAVALFTTLFLYVFGKTTWPVIMLLWTVLPLANAIAFLRCPLARPLPAEERSSAASILKSPVFLLLLLVILCAGASELTLSQWTSAYMEEVLHIPKVIGDVAGMCLFAAMMGAGRVLNGLFGSIRPEKTAVSGIKNSGLRNRMLVGAALSFVCYIVVALSSGAVAGLIACALCGLGVSLLWPGALSLSVDAFPKAGSWMMAILAAAGDMGASIGPWLAGVWADHAGLRTSLLFSAIYPLGVVLCLWRPGLRKRRKHVKD